jgi:hypothetical protein
MRRTSRRRARSPADRRHATLARVGPSFDRGAGRGRETEVCAQPAGLERVIPPLGSGHPWVAGPTDPVHSAVIARISLTGKFAGTTVTHVFRPSA